ncbi:unnamed protein product [Cuscuta campestris]|uniref:Uncharacterized protein n=1 Tax=Cuscuta campestris TaxID=132261 RepID=A0A484LBS2_9ASTE|nr:unnamed protein product [Cuscuta campestris]
MPFTVSRFLDSEIVVECHPEIIISDDILIRSHRKTPSGVQSAATARRLSFIVSDARTVHFTELPQSHRKTPFFRRNNNFLAAGNFFLCRVAGRHVIVVIEDGVLDGGAGLEQGSPAEGTRGVGEEPGVDAADVEGVAARRQQPELVLLSELAQADGAVEGLRRLRRAAKDLSVDEHRQGVDEGLVQSAVVLVEEVVELSLEGFRVAYYFRSRRRRRGGLLDEQSDEQVEQAGDEEQDGDGGYDDNHCRA